MSPSKPSACPRCGAAIPARAAEELCPACLLAGALEAPDEFPRELGGYRLLGVLGGGGMGTVYEAEQTATARRVALKVLGHELDSPEMRQRFLREGRLAAGVSHPNSLYVFGTEEIEGRPVITMEIAGGGTLGDRLKKRGPLPVAEAVDAVLDVVSGLKAAHAAGVLHRDIKPSNCFVSSDGSVKIGDFGLSVSTLAQDDSYLTGTGVILGTPAFASPEQLRGRELDVRADIYSVGATVFTLLTGKPPIAGRNPVEVVAAALEERPQALTELRDDVPAGLAQVVARCLAKRPEQRYPDYAALRAALLPFGSTRPEPAPLGRRLFAGFMDVAVCGIIPAVAAYAFFGFDLDDGLLFTERSPAVIAAWAGLAAFFVLYHALFEGLFGASLGKALMGLRMARADGRAPGLGRALVRSSINTLFGNLGKLLCFLTITAEQYAAGGAVVVGASNLVAFLAYATMRRRNGFATVWDLATGTRVVLRPKRAARPAIDVVAPPAASASGAEPIGPYSVAAEVVPARWISARDDALRRRVWLRRRTSELTPARRDVARPGRNRWLQSVETPAATWDVFEAPPGVPLRDLLRGDGGLSWESLRHWLHDLAAEVASAAKDRTLPPELGLDHVWITAEGRAVLLDEAWPGGDGRGELVAVADLAGRQRFLHGVAARAHPATVPLHARVVLDSLAAGSFEKLSFLVGSLRSLLSKPARLDRQLRAASLLAVPLFLMTFVSLLVIGDRAGGGSMSAESGLPEVLLIPILTLFVLGACLALPQLVVLLALRATPGQFVFGFAVVDAAGAPAGRARLLVRWLIAWSLPAAVFAYCGWVGEADLGGLHSLSLLALLPWLFGLALAVLRPARGPHDRWSGCWLVPR
ncbi:MAG: protein kinase [Planctomycetota bacterium]